MRPVTLFAAAIGLSLLALAGTPRAVPVAAQEELPCDISYTRTVEPHQVMLNETVRIRITVNGACEEGSVGKDVFFVVDRSNTMFDAGFMNNTKAALQRFIGAMDFSHSHAGLATFALNTQINVPLSTDRQRLQTSINAIRRAEETDVRGLQGAFRTATQQLQEAGNPANEKIVIVIAAGPDASEANINMPTVTQAARNAGVKVIFLMFPQSRFLHYVEAATDCSLPLCPTWTGPRGGALKKWAFGVDTNSIGTMLDTLVQVLLRPPTVQLLSVEEWLYSGAEALPDTFAPPPTRVVIQPYRDNFWEYPNLIPGGLTIEYEARLVLPGVEPVTDVSELLIDFGGGMPPARLPLPNPPITVIDPTVATATPDSPTPGTPETPDPTETPETPDPPETPGTPETPVVTPPTGGSRVFMPAAVARAPLR